MIGYRLWVLTYPSPGDRSSPILAPQHYSGEWVPGANTATCQAVWWGNNPDPQKRHVGDISPVSSCTCGLWFLSSLSDAIKRADKTSPFHPFARIDVVTRVVGAVRVWGKIVEHVNGYRAEKAMIVALLDRKFDVLNSELIHKAAKVYDVPVYTDHDEMIAFVESLDA